MTNHRACTDRVVVGIERVAGSGYLGQDEVTLDIACRRIGCGWPAGTWDTKQGGPMSVDDLLEFQKAHDRWVEEGERVQFGPGIEERRAFLDGKPVGWLSKLGSGYGIALDSGFWIATSSLESARRFVEERA